MVLLTLKHLVAYIFYGMSAFAASFVASLLGGFEEIHPAWTSLRALALYSTVIVLLAVLAAVMRSYRSVRRPTYRLAV